MNSIIQELRSKEVTRSPVHIAKHLETIADYHGSDNEPLGEFLTKHLFFITARFDTKRVVANREALRNSLAEFKGTSWGRLLGSGLADRMPTQLSEFGKLHFHIARYLLACTRFRRHRVMCFYGTGCSL
jgi:hypothetical protein